MQLIFVAALLGTFISCCKFGFITQSSSYEPIPFEPFPHNTIPTPSYDYPCWNRAWSVWYHSQTGKDNHSRLTILCSRSLFILPWIPTTHTVLPKPSEQSIYPIQTNYRESYRRKHRRISQEAYNPKCNDTVDDKSVNSVNNNSCQCWQFRLNR